MWYNVKEGTPHVPLRATGVGMSEFSETPNYDTGGNFITDVICRGDYAIVAIVMGWDEGTLFFGDEVVSVQTLPGVNARVATKNEHFNILSITPYYRYSRR